RGRADGAGVLKGIGQGHRGLHSMPKSYRPAVPRDIRGRPLGSSTEARSAPVQPAPAAGPLFQTPPRRRGLICITACAWRGPQTAPRDLEDTVMSLELTFHGAA